jgi:hypothetical protein
MRSRDRVRLTVAIFLAAGALCLRGSAEQPAAKAAADCGGCANCQSPRELPASIPYQPPSIVNPGPDDATILYGLIQQPLHRCSQHYHCSIENHQVCDPKSAVATHPPAECSPLHAGDWVEIHTVFAPVVGTGCKGNYEITDCCEGDPKVVLAYHARVTSDTLPGPVPVYWGRPVPGPVPAFWGTTEAEWSGSTTGPDKASERDKCKPAALWSFALGCDFTVSLGQLALFKHPEPARGLQPENRLSKDLRRVKRLPTK